MHKLIFCFIFALGGINFALQAVQNVLDDEEEVMVIPCSHLIYSVGDVLYD